MVNLQPLFINTTGDARLPHVVLKATKDAKTGLIDSTGNVLFPFVLKDILSTELDPFYTGWLAEMPGGQTGYLSAITHKLHIPGLKP